MKNLSTDPITDGTPLTPVERTFFDDLVKSAEDTQTHTNEDEVVEGHTPDPPQPEHGKNDDPTWGEDAGQVSAGQQPAPAFSNVARQQFIEGREKLLEELLPEASETSDPAQQAIVSSQFETKAYETSSPQLNKGASIETLSERVRRLVG